ncbi:M64 family metallopeptidase [Microcoleus sp. w2-18bC1]|uniref:M64 family metallopeptidase n=2 Tax=Microcoleus TaxID=44471 RepID=UPI002FD4FCC9
MSSIDLQLAEIKEALIMPDSMTQILKAGPPGNKRNIAVLGDGFAEADQNVYNQKVKEILLDGVFGHDYFYEDAQAFNIYRVNLISNDSGVSQRVYDEKGTPADPSDDVIVSTTLRNTALRYIFNGSWAHCWLEEGANTATLVQNALNTWVPDYDLVLIILNESGFGGCAWGNKQHVTLGSSWEVMAHEFGHGIGNLADEYCQPGTYIGGEPGSVNITVNSNRATLKWRRFVNPATPVPTGVNASPNSGACTNHNQGTKPLGWSSSQDVGLFEGAQYRDKGIYRPVENCRMRGNSPPFCPVCYTALKEKHHPYTGRTFSKCYAGDFNGDGKDDLLVHNDNSIQIYRSNGSKLDMVFSVVERVPGSWQFKPNDQFYIGDFNGDGKDEVVIYNSTDWGMEYLGLLVDDGNNGLELVARYDDSMPGWQFQKSDRFYVADFDGDGKKDLFVFNGVEWPTPYLGMLRSTGSGFSLVKRYDGSLPSWQMGKNDRHYVGDFDGDGKEDLWVFNGSDWSIPYLGILRSQSTFLSMVKRYDNTLPGWQMKPNDQHYVGDFNGDGKADLYIFNGQDWSMAYLGMLSSNGAVLNMVKRYDDTVPGWQMRKNDSHYLADINGDGKVDLFVYNCKDWSREYLGTMISNGSALSSNWVEDWVGEWNLGAVDQFIPCNYEGVAGKRDLFVHNQNWFGMIRANPVLSLQKIYYRWIHNYRYGRNW